MTTKLIDLICQSAGEFLSGKHFKDLKGREYIFKGIKADTSTDFDHTWGVIQYLDEKTEETIYLKRLNEDTPCEIPANKSKNP